MFDLGDGRAIRDAAFALVLANLTDYWYFLDILSHFYNVDFIKI